MQKMNSPSAPARGVYVKMVSLTPGPGRGCMQKLAALPPGPGMGGMK